MSKRKTGLLWPALAAFWGRGARRSAKESAKLKRLYPLS